MLHLSSKYVIWKKTKYGENPFVNPVIKEGFLIRGGELTSDECVV